MPDRPNVVVLVSHDTGRFVSPYGVDTVDTPNFERLAAESVRFANACTTAPQCSPSRAALFTGRYPHQNGVMGLCNPGYLWDMHETERPIGRLLGEAGYATWSLGNRHEATTAERLGFEVARPLPTVLDMPDALDELLRDRDVSRPCYCQLAPFETHRDWTAHDTAPDDSKGVTVPPYLNDGPRTREEMAAMQGIAKRLDVGLGRLMDLLERHGLVENTILVVTTDHGLALPRAKCSLFDPGIETLLFMRWPGGGWPNGAARDELISNIDVLPTLLEACGLDVPEAVAGRSFLPLFTGGDYTPRQELFAEKTYHGCYDPTRAIRTERYKYIASFERTTLQEVAGDYYLHGAHVELGAGWGRRQLEELYDLEADPNEQSNVVKEAAYEQTLIDLRRRLADWMRETGDPLLDGPIAGPSYHQMRELLFGNA